MARTLRDDRGGARSGATGDAGTVVAAIPPPVAFPRPPPTPPDPPIAPAKEPDFVALNRTPKPVALNFDPDCEKLRNLGRGMCNLVLYTEFMKQNIGKSNSPAQIRDRGLSTGAFDGEPGEGSKLRWAGGEYDWAELAAMK